MALPLSAPVSSGALEEQNQRDQPVEPELEQHFKALNRAKAAGDDEAAKAIQGFITEATTRLRTQVATRGMSEGDKFLAGAGGAMDRVGRGVADIATLGMRSHDAQADEDRKLAQDQLKATDSGTAGDFVGDAAATAPIGMGVGGAMRKVGTKLGSMGLTAASKLLSSTPVRAALEGAAMGAADAQPGERGEGALASGAMAGGLALAGKALRRTATGIVKPSPSAAYLKREGVDLTLGQMNPTGKLAQLEEASQSAPGFGRTIENQRAAGRESWQDAMLKKTVPPGGSVPPRAPGNMPTRIDDIYKQFDPAYDAAVKSESVYPATHGKTPTPLQSTARGKPGAFDLAVMDPSALATDQERASVKKFLDHQLSILPGGTVRPSMLQQVPAESLQQMRSNIRAAVRTASSSGDMKVAKLLVNAERQVGEVLNTQLKNPDALRAVDRSYSRYKVVEGAQANANGAPSDFTPAQALREVKGGMSKGLFARGGGGDMRRMSTAGRDTIDARVPATGARVLTHSIPAAIGAIFGPAGAAAGAAGGPSATAAAIAALNSGPAKAFLTGSTKPQRAAQMLELALRRGLGRSGSRSAVDMATLAAALAGSRQSQGSDQ